MLERVLGAAAAIPLLLGAAAAPADHEHVLFRFQDPEITESSDIVVLGGGLFATANDSGDTGRVFVLDARGDTVGVTRWEDHPTDVEALAPAPDGRLWVGDIGDNTATRSSVQVAEVSVGRGSRTEHPTPVTLTYPDGPHDAETLLCGPDGRLYIATKGFLGGHLYAAPYPLRDGTLTRTGPDDAVLPMADDGVFVAPGEVMIRNYESAALYAFPSMRLLGTQDLPAQRQGEGLGYADGTLYLSSEGLHSEVLTLPLDPTPVAGTTGPSPTPGASEASGARVAPVTEPATEEETHRRWWPWLTGGAALVVLGGVLVRSLRPR